VKAQAEAISKGVNDRVAFRVSDDNDLPFQDQTFDRAIFQVALIFTNKSKALKMAHQKIRISGFLGVVELAWKKTLQKESSRKLKMYHVPQHSTLNSMKIGHDCYAKMVSRSLNQNC